MNQMLVLLVGVLLLIASAIPASASDCDLSANPESNQEYIAG